MRDLIKARLKALAFLRKLVARITPGRIEDAISAYDRRDYVTALRLFRPPAKLGDVTAQYTLGQMYSLGQGVPQDFAEAAKWLRLAADNGHTRAQAKLGSIFAHGS